MRESQLEIKWLIPTSTISKKFSAYRRPPRSAPSALQVNLDRKSNMQGNNSSSNVARIFVKTSK